MNIYILICIEVNTLESGQSCTLTYDFNLLTVKGLTGVFIEYMGNNSLMEVKAFVGLF